MHYAVHNYGYDSDSDYDHDYIDYRFGYDNYLDDSF